MERLQPPLQLEPSEIEALCRPFFGRKASIESIETLTGGAVNATYKLVCADKAYVLRCYLREETDPEIEAAVYEKVKGILSTPKRLFTSSKERLHFVLMPFCGAPPIYKAKKPQGEALSYDLGAFW